MPRGTTVLGVDIGGRTEAEAAEALLAGLGDRLGEPVPLTLDGAGQTVDPAAVGLNLDADGDRRRGPRRAGRTRCGRSSVAPGRRSGGHGRPRACRGAPPGRGRRARRGGDTGLDHLRRADPEGRLRRAGQGPRCAGRGRGPAAGLAAGRAGDGPAEGAAADPGGGGRPGGGRVRPARGRGAGHRHHARSASSHLPGGDRGEPGHQSGTPTAASPRWWTRRSCARRWPTSWPRSSSSRRTPRSRTTTASRRSSRARVGGGSTRPS